MKFNPYAVLKKNGTTLSKLKVKTALNREECHKSLPLPLLARYSGALQQLRRSLRRYDKEGRLLSFEDN